MRKLCFCVFLVLGVSSAFSQCIFPPCESDEEIPPENLPADECCTELREELAVVRQNLTELWKIVAETRETAAKHLSELYRYQMQTLRNQTGLAETDTPPSDVDKGERRRSYSSRRRSRYYRRRGHHHHHHHECPPADNPPNPKAFNRPPKVRNIEEFDFAICHMEPNGNVNGSTVQGVVYLSQKKNSDTVYLHALLQGFNTSTTQHEGPAPEGHVHQDEEKVYKHGFHVHETADFSNGCDSAGPHYNPHQVNHGGPDSTVRHVGDFGNLASDNEGAINELITDEVASLRGEYSIIGKSLVVHALEDDLGTHADDTGSTSTGNSGSRLACCVIKELKPEPNPENTNSVRTLSLEELEKQIVPNLGAR